MELTPVKESNPTITNTQVPSIKVDGREQRGYTIANASDDVKPKAIATFTERFLSHGYPIDKKICEEVGLNVIEIDEALENNICYLHEIYEDLIIEVERQTMLRRLNGCGSPEEEAILELLEEGMLIVQANSKRIITLNGQDITPN